MKRTVGARHTLFYTLVLVLLMALLLSPAGAQGPEGERPGRPSAGPLGQAPEERPAVGPAAPTALTWQIERVDAPKTFLEMGSRSLALDALGHPHIAYGGDHLYYAWYDGTSWHLETADPSWNVGRYTSLALDAMGRPHISYYDETKRDLKYAYFDGSAWITETVDTNPGWGGYTSLALDTMDRPHISYFDETNSDLKYARQVGLQSVYLPLVFKGYEP